MSKLRFVIDTNTLVSSILIPSSVPAQAFSLMKQLGIFLVSIPTIEELQEVLTRPKFDKYVSASTRSEFVAQFIELALKGKRKLTVEHIEKLADFFQVSPSVFFRRSPVLVLVLEFLLHSVQHKH